MFYTRRSEKACGQLAKVTLLSMERMMSDDDQATPDVARQGEADGLSGLEEFDEQAAGTIRRVFHEGRWFFSVIDVVGLSRQRPS